MGKIISLHLSLQKLKDLVSTNTVREKSGAHLITDR
jgi:hypothetical protein